MGEAVDEILVQLEDFGAVDLGGVVGGEGGVWEKGVLWEVAGGVVGGDLIVGEFVLQVELYSVVGECYGASSCQVGIYACDSCNEKVCLLQAEQWGVDQGADAGGSIDLAFASGYLANIACFGAVDVREKWTSPADSNVLVVEAGHVLIPHSRFRIKHGDDEDLGGDGSGSF